MDTAWRQLANLKAKGEKLLVLSHLKYMYKAMQN